jgi:hypothetical protein
MSKDKKIVPNNAIIFECEKCNFTCSKNSNYLKHLTTAKHIRITTGQNDNSKLPIIYKCHCGKIYNFQSGLCKHKKKCKFQPDNSQDNSQENLQIEHINPEESPVQEEVSSPKEADKRDEIIDKLVTSNTEMKDMMMMLMKSQLQNQENTKEILQETTRQNQENTKEIMQETSRQNQEMQKQTQETTTNLMNKVVEVLPQMGNTTNNNNTLNFYLTDTCKDAESIHEFTDRFIERVVKFFRGNYRDIAYKRISLPDNVRDIFYECLDENPQTQNFVQTTDVKNGVCYVKEKKKNEECEYYGEAEFVKYKDGFTKSGIRLGHAINCALLPCKSECLPMLAKDFKEKPNEEDYDEEHEEDFQRDKDSYYNTTRAIQDTLMYQTIKAMNIFDSKKTRENTLTKTKRTK